MITTAEEAIYSELLKLIIKPNFIPYESHPVIYITKQDVKVFLLILPLLDKVVIAVKVEYGSKSQIWKQSISIVCP